MAGYMYQHVGVPVEVKERSTVIKEENEVLDTITMAYVGVYEEIHCLYLGM